MNTNIYFDINNEIPVLNIEDKYIIPLTNNTFIKSYINYYDNDMKFKLGNMSGNGMKYKWYDEDQGIIEFYLKNKYICNITTDILYNIFKEYVSWRKENGKWNIWRNKKEI